MHIDQTVCYMILMLSVLIFLTTQFIRSPRSRFIRITEEGVREVLSINVAISSAVTYPEGTLGRTLSFRTNFQFSEKRRYYVTLDPGTAYEKVVMYGSMHD
jgi:hypothetical protein